MTSVDNPN